MLIWTRNNLLIIALALLFVQCGASKAEMPPIPHDRFRAGDVAFRLGRTLESDAIASVAEDDFRFSHVGVVVGRGDSLIVVHVEPEREGEERIKAEPLDEFFHPSRAIKGVVVRREQLSDNHRQTIEREALRLLQLKIRFDHDYSLQDSTAMYCTELVDYLFQKVGATLTHRRYDVPLVREGVILPHSMLQDGDLRRVWGYDLRSARHN